MSFVVKCFPAAGYQDGALYKCCLLRSEVFTFRAKPLPKCGAKFFQGPTRYFVLSYFPVSLSRALLPGPLRWG